MQLLFDGNNWMKKGNKGGHLVATYKYFSLFKYFQKWLVAGWLA